MRDCRRGVEKLVEAAGNTLSLSLSRESFSWKIPAYGSSIKSEQAPRRERERERKRGRERTRARRRVTACIPRVASIRAIARKGMTPKGHCSLAWPALLCSALLCSAPLCVPCSVSSSGSTPVLPLLAHRPALSRAFVERNTGESFRRERERTSADVA